ncbi:MAG: DUF6069 family protein [Pseudonocardiaceae bacterium]
MSTTEISPLTDTRPTARARGTAVIAAVCAALVVWIIAAPLLGVALTVVQGAGTQQVGPAAVLLVSALVGLAGWALLAVLERWTRSARSIWTALAGVVTLVSLAGPLSATTTSATVSLTCLHLAVAAVLMSLLGRSAAVRR